MRGSGITGVRSKGEQYFREAFEPGPYRLGHLIASDKSFYLTFVRYVLAFTVDIVQLVHFRVSLIHRAQEVLRNSRSYEAQHTAPNPAITWCALSLAADQYFSDRAAAFGWSVEEEEELSSGWYELMAPAFIAQGSPRRIDASQLKAFREKFFASTRRDFGPFDACEYCTNRCAYGHEVAKLRETYKFANFTNAVRAPNPAKFAAETVVNMCRQLTGGASVDLAYCIASSMVSDSDFSIPDMDNFLIELRVYADEMIQGAQEEAAPAATDAAKEKPSSSLDKQGMRGQIFEVVVRQALAGAPWREICGQVMRLNNITDEEVEREVMRRRQLQEEK